MTHQRNFSFGLGRNKVSLNGIVPSQLNKGCAPGPGTYPLGSTKSRINYSFAIRPKPTLTSNHFAPGAGTYQLPESINSEGKYAISKYMNSKAPRISNSSQSRFQSFDASTFFGYLIDIKSFQLLGSTLSLMGLIKRVFITCRSSGTLFAGPLVKAVETH